MKSTELALELTTPEPAEWARPHHHEYLRGLGPQLEDGLEGARKLVVDRDCGLLVSKRSVSEKPPIDGREQDRRVGKELLSISAREGRGRAGDRDDQIRLRTVKEGGSDVVDHHVFWRADKACWPHHDLHDVHSLRRAPDQFDAEVAGELVNRERPSVERLQHQHVADRRLGVARCRAEQNHDREQARRYHPWESSTRAGLVHDAE